MGAPEPWGGMRRQDFHDHRKAENLAAGCFSVLVLITTSAVAIAQTGAFVAPPRNISDVTAILDQQKPDASKANKARAEADASPPASAKGATLGQFYFNRCQARATLGRTRDAIADCESAVAQGGDYLRDVSRYHATLSNLYRAVGEYRKSIEVEQTTMRELEKLPRTKGRFFGINLRIALNHLSMGELAQAEIVIKRNQALLNESKAWPNVEMFRSSWAYTVERGNAHLLQARGKYAEAEAGYRRAQSLQREAISLSASWPVKPPPGVLEEGLDFLIMSEGLMKVTQRKLAEGESDVRRALISRLKAVGKYHPSTAQASFALAHVLTEQSRYSESEKLARSAVEIYRALGYPEEVPLHANALN